ncbi:MAG: RusA family crossover junction endodeoxyribonuclease [Planctomycetes bacterium]|nr:RusA family crossover junction endodeoxyribonuclease [Planctomycetota bacterium]
MEPIQIQFDAPCVPVAQPRQRHRAVVLKSGRTVVSNYTPRTAPVNAFKATVRLAFRKAWSGPPLQGPVCLRLEFRMPRPKSKLWKRKPMPSYPHTTKPDLDNLTKAVKDALTGLAWIDDSQICDLRATKRVCSGDESPGVTVRIDHTPADTFAGETNPRPTASRRSVSR